MNLFFMIVFWMIGNKLSMGEWYYVVLIVGLTWSLANYKDRKN